MDKVAQEYAPNYHRFVIKSNMTDWKYHFVCSDIHLDNPKCKRKKLKEDLDMAKALGATISITGDLLDLMQGKHDRRADKGALRKDFVEGGSYIDNVIKDAVAFLSPYAENIVLISKGNHETSVQQHIEVDVLKYLIRELNKANNTKIQMGEYRGYFTLCYQLGKTGNRHNVNFGYSHGNWGGNITKGALSVIRDASIMPDCDIMLSGHTHDTFVIPHKRYSIKSGNSVNLTTQYHVKTATYKDEFSAGHGFAVEKIAFPKPIGGCLCKFKIGRNGEIKMRFELTVD